MPKEVKIFYLKELSEGSDTPAYVGSYHPRGRGHGYREVVEKQLAELLNEGWQIAGTGGSRLRHAFVILVRET